jgi:hypothetical protein
MRLWRCAAEPGPVITMEFVTVPVLQRTAKGAALRPGQVPLLPVILSRDLDRRGGGLECLRHGAFQLLGATG